MQRFSDDAVLLLEGVVVLATQASDVSTKLACSEEED